METSPNKTEAKGFRAKDLIALGVFGLLMFVVTMVVETLASLTVVTHLLGVPVSGLLAGVIWTYLRVRVPKPWAMLIPGCLCGVVMFLIGAGWPLALGYIVGTLLAEACSAIGKYRSFWWNAVGFALVNSGFAVGYLVPMYLNPQYYVDMMTANSTNVEYGWQIMNSITPESIAGVTALAFVCGIVGSLLGKLLLKRHFERAGIA